MQTARFRWFILISFMIHTVFLWLFHFVPLHELKPFPPLEVGLLTIPPTPQPETSIQPGRTGQPTGQLRRYEAQPYQALSSSNKKGPPVIHKRRFLTRRRNVHRAWRNFFRYRIHCSGIRRNSHWQRIAFRHRGTSSAPTGTKGGFPGSGGTPTGTKTGSAGSEIDAFSGVEIPVYVIDAAGFRSRCDSDGSYPEIDFYVLYGVDKQIGIPVPGTEVCIEGDQLRTKERMTITEIKSDHSKCRYLELGDDAPPRVICPPEAHTYLNHYAASPLPCN